MQAHCRHLHLKGFSMLLKKNQSNEFWPLKQFSKNSEVHQNFNSQSGSPLGSVWVHFLTLSYTLGSMKCDSQASLLARTSTSPSFGWEPKAKVAISGRCVWKSPFLWKIITYTLHNEIRWFKSILKCSKMSYNLFSHSIINQTSTTRPFYFILMH
jgi:hypothetical protein